MRRPAGGAGTREHRREHVRGHLGEVQYDGRPELDVRPQRPVGIALGQLLDRGLLQCLGHLVTRGAELFRRTTKNACPWVLGAVDAVPEAHQAFLAVEDGLDVGRRVPGALDLVEHREHA